MKVSESYLNSTSGHKIVTGIGVSSGVGLGPAFFLHSQEVSFVKTSISSNQIQTEIDRFYKALKHSISQLKLIRKNIETIQIGNPSLIIDAYLMILRDDLLIQGTKSLIRDEQINAEWALSKVDRSIRGFFDLLEDKILRERRDDVRFVVRRVMANLLGKPEVLKVEVPENAVIIAHSLSPVDTVFLSEQKIGGFVTEIGSKTSHTAIMAGSMEVPAVVGVENITGLIEAGDMVLIDGTTGEVIIKPHQSDMSQFHIRVKKRTNLQEALSSKAQLVARTRDGRVLDVMGNLEFEEEVEKLKLHGGSGVGLFRTEFLFMKHSRLPDEEEQYKYYRRMVKSLDGLPVSIRTLDLGGDKFLSTVECNEHLKAHSPLRAIRLCLQNHPLFVTQLRAVLRASAHGPVRLMLPFISGLEEVLEAKHLIKESQNALKEEGKSFDEKIKVGIMIEIPSAVMVAEVLAKEVDFFSVGTNDLIQYSMAIDRANEHQAHLYRPLHPALLRMLGLVTEAARNNKIDVNICGEMAGEPMYTQLLIGMGFRGLSMNPKRIPVIKEIIRNSTVSEARKLWKKVTKFHGVQEIEDHVRCYMKGAFPHLFEDAF